MAQDRHNAGLTDLGREATPARAAHSPMGRGAFGAPPHRTPIAATGLGGPLPPPACRLAAPHSYDFGMHSRRAERLGRQGF